MLKKLMILLLFIVILPIVYSAQEANIGAYVLNVGKYELATGSYTIDFYLSIKCDQKCDPNIEFMNGRATSLEKIIDKPNDKFYRIQASLQEQVNLENFPFDKQKLTILIEDKEKPIGDFVDAHPTIKILALSFLIMVGITLIIEGFDVHVPKGYIYFAMAFSVGVEMLNIRMRNKREKPVKLHKVM